MSHIEKCRNLYYATLKVPAELRVRLGRTKFKRSLGTADKRRAQELAKPVIALWKAQIRQAQGEPAAVQTEALRWREALQAQQGAGGGEALQDLELVLLAKVDALREARGSEEADRFADVALGHATPSSLHYEEWSASIAGLTPKTQDQYRSDVKALIKRFETLEAMTPSALRQWAQEMTSRGSDPVSPASLKRMVSCWRSYWSFLEQNDIVKPGSQPFGLIQLPRRGKASTPQGWRPFKPAEVVTLAKAAREGGDDVLADLVTLAAYSGARIEELCALRWEHVSESAFRIVDAKTRAGVREVPVHPALAPVLERLRGLDIDGYVLPGLSFNKYGDRSNAIGKRFGRLKTAAGFGPEHVFHSIRKTLVTMLEDAGVSENLTADIVGHEKPRITYGLYSGGASLSTKRSALERIEYPSSF